MPETSSVQEQVISSRCYRFFELAKKKGRVLFCSQRDARGSRRIPTRRLAAAQVDVNTKKARADQKAEGPEECGDGAAILQGVGESLPETKARAPVGPLSPVKVLNPRRVSRSCGSCSRNATDANVETSNPIRSIVYESEHCSVGIKPTLQRREG